MEHPLPLPAALGRSFEQGLARLLEEPGLGPLILVLANASFEGSLLERFRGPLHRRFEASRAEYLDTLGRGRRPRDASDDVAVFCKLLGQGLDSVRPTELGMLGPWQLQLNPLRALRPPRMASAAAPGLRRPFDPAGFHFNRPSVRKELLWSGELSGRAVSLFYNKFPLLDRHALLVPDPDDCRPQYLERRDHCFVWDLLESSAGSLEGLGFGFNSYGAFASVNHLHAQTFVRTRPLPITYARWAHNGGPDAYPLDCRRFGAPSEAWDFVAHLHRREISYNLIYLPGRVYCVPRARQGTYRGASWSGGFGWYEVAGGFAVSTRDAFERLDEAGLSASLANLALC